MREDAFRAYLAPLLGGPKVVASYLSNARLIEKRLHIDLDGLNLDGTGVVAIRSRLVEAGVPTSKAGDCTSALRQYARFRSTGSAVAAPTTKTGAVATEPPPRHPVLAGLDTPGLMRLYGDLIAELRGRGISRTANGPVGDYAEHLFASAFAWRLASNSESGFDAIDVGGQRYQIKARRLGTPRASRQLGALRRLPERTFDVLAAVLFDETMAVQRAALIPYDIVALQARRVEHTNSWRIMLWDQLCSLPGVIDATGPLRRAAA